MDENKVLRFISVLIFNIAEVIVVFLLGKLFGIDTNIVISIMLSFILFKFIFKKTKHYKSIYTCFIWTILVFLSLFLLSSLSMINILMFTAFTAFIVSGKADISDITMWKNNGEPSKYQDVVDYIKYHPMDKDLMDFEETLKRQDSLLYLVYKYRFKDQLTFKEIEEKIDVSDKRITEMLDKIAFAMRMTLKF